MKMSKSEIAQAMSGLIGFMGPYQGAAMIEGMKGEEAEFFKISALEWSVLILTMPKSYETDGQGMAAVAQLHYFKGGMDWYITEKDAGEKADGSPGQQHQAFGWADLGYGGELGYISIAEIIANGGELDLHWAPKPLGQIAKIKVAA